MTERKYTVDEIRRWANNPNTALYSALHAESATVEAMATEAAASATSAADAAVVTSGSRYLDAPYRSAIHPISAAERGSPSLPSRSRTPWEPERTGLAGIRGLTARLRRHWQTVATPSRALFPRLRGRGTGRSPVDLTAGRQSQASPCSVCSASSVGAAPATGTASSVPGSGTGLTFSLAPGRVTVLFEPDRLDVADVIAAVSEVVKRGGRP